LAHIKLNLKKKKHVLKLNIAIYVEFLSKIYKKMSQSIKFVICWKLKKVMVC